jgi:DNA-directed RNA polymerase
MPTVDEQIALEIEMVNAGIARYEKDRAKLEERGLASKTKHGRALISSIIEAVASQIKQVQETPTSNRDVARKKLADVDADKAAYLALIAAVDGVAKRYTLLKIARAIGMNIEDQWRLQKWIEADPETAKNVLRLAEEKSGRHHKRRGLVHKMNADGHLTGWSNEERIFVGLRLMDAIIVSTGIFELRLMTTGKNKTTTYVEATPETLNWIRSFNESAMLRRPRYVPCIIEPKPWEDVWGGGYYSDVINRLPMVRAH